jgi:hypothetical protein
MQSICMLNVALLYFYAERHSAECRYADCRYAECRYAECRAQSSTVFDTARTRTSATVKRQTSIFY